MATKKTSIHETPMMPSLPKSGSLQPILIVLLVVASFLLGSLWTEVRYLKRGNGSATTAQQAPAPAGTGVQETMTVEKLPEIAKDAGLDQSKFSECLNSAKFAQHVEDDYQSGVKAGINGTPGSILLDTKTGQTTLIPGAVPYEQMKSAIDALLAGNAPTGTPISVDPIRNDDHVQGNRNARIAMIEYSDLQCPFCKRFHPTTKQVLDEFKDQVVFVYRHFPLDQLHPAARKAAEGSECAREIAGEDGFWKFVDRIFEG